MIIEDWRLTNQENYLKNALLKYLSYAKNANLNDHDHCEFCWAKFSAYENDIHEGYCTLDEYHWICEKCYNDFKEFFDWKIS